MHKYFSKEYTLIVKGVAIILMLIHHLFYDYGNIENFSLLFDNLEADFWVTSSYISKVCVAIFAVLSGYGLSKSYKRKGENNLIEFVIKHIKSLLYIYWWAVIPFVVLGHITGLRTLGEVYGTGTTSILKGVLDLFGIGYIIYGFDNMYNVTCWYIGEILILYLFFPLFMRASKYNFIKTTILFLIIYRLSKFIPNFVPLYLLCFCFGMLLEKYGILDYLVQYIGYKLSTLFFFTLFLSCIFIRIHQTTKIDLLLTLSIIGLALTFAKDNKLIFNILSILGKHSANIFMVHTFFYYYFFPTFIHYPKYPMLVLLFLLSICLIYSIFLERVKNYLKKILVLI